MKNSLKILAVILFFPAILQAQVDPHFSQYYANPLWLNPALTGVINGDARLSTNFKNQWPSVNNAYITGGLTADLRPSDHLGIGVSLINQSAGGSSYNHFSAYGSLSYGIKLSASGNSKLHFGMQLGVIRKSFDPSDLQFGSQYNPSSGYDPTLSSMESSAGDQNSVFDAGAGLFYYDGDPLKQLTFFGGVSAGHITRPKDSFSGSFNNKIPVRYSFHGGLKIRANDRVDLIPNGLYITQQRASIKALGLYSEVRMGADRGLILGSLYRFNDAAVADVGYHINGMILGASYDFNTSSLNRATAGRGGFEISLSYVIRKKLSQPEPICPRL